MKKTYNYNGIIYDSQEEVDFAQWIEEAAKAGYIEQVEYHPAPFLITDKKTIPVEIQLKTKTKTVNKHLLAAHAYQADFRIVFSDLFLKKYDHGLLTAKALNEFWIDVKGTFNQNDAHRRFSIDQKLVYDKYGIFINKVIPAYFFKHTWVPLACAFMKNRIELTRKKNYADCKLFYEIEQ